MVRFALRLGVSKISHILSFPIDYHVKRQKKNKKIWQKSKFEISQILYIFLVETFPKGMHDFFGANLLCTFRQGVVSHVNQNEKKLAKIQNLNIANIYTTLVETLPRSVHDFFLQWIFYVLSEEMLKVFLPYGPMLTKTKKIKKCKIL